MKESITKFDLEAAFKALDEIEMPKADKVKANKPALTEIFSRKSKFDALMEEYYDISDMSELDDAKEAREAEVAQAKLARIEKIVDLDAESPEDLLPSYVGKFIMQCPQCMTLFYKDPEDVEASEEDPNTVNINEVCQHCGNESGYTLIGKVGEATQDEMSDFTQEETVDVASTEESEEELTDEVPDEPSEEDLDIELDELDLDLEDIEDDAEEKTEESFNVGGGETLVEALTEEAELEVSADEFEKLINSAEFKKPISDTEARAMIDEVESENEDDKSEVKEGLGEDTDFLSDAIHDLFNTSKFSHSRLSGDKVPMTKKLADDTYKVVHPVSKAAVVVKFDVTNKEDSTLKFTVNDKSYVTKELTKAQNFILAELDAAHAKKFDITESVEVNNETLRFAVINPDGTYAGVPCTSEEEARDLAAQKEGRIIVKLGQLIEKLEEGSIKDLKDKLKDKLIGSGAGKLTSRSDKADWICKYALEDYQDAEPSQRFHTFVVIGYTDKYSNGKAITMAPSFNNKDLIVGKNGIKEIQRYKDADKVAKGWSMIQGNGPAFIYLAKSKDDPNAVFLCEYFKGELTNDQLDKYLQVVKDHLKGAKLMKDGGVESNTEKVESTTDEAATNESADKNKLDTLMSGVIELQEAAIEKLISDSLIEAYGNVAGFRLAECAYINEKLTVDGTIYFTSGNKRKTTYKFFEALVSDDNKATIRGINEKLGLDKQFTITGHTDCNRTFITESFKVTKK